MKRVVGLSVTALALAFGPAAGAQETSSAYTSLDLRRDCRHSAGAAVEDYGVWRCRGFAGVPIRVGAGDQRMYVSFGPQAGTEPAAAQTLAPFNDFHAGVVEWRLAAGKPFATILRWSYKTAADRETREARGRALVVTRLPPGPVCHVGYVDARANARANELARALADAHARGFVCGRDRPIIGGKVGRGAAFAPQE